MSKVNLLFVNRIQLKVPAIGLNSKPESVSVVQYFHKFCKGLLMKTIRYQYNIMQKVHPRLHQIKNKIKSKNYT